MSHHAEILAYVSRREMRHVGRTEQRKCACGEHILSYLPERRVGNVTHGVGVCVRYGKRVKP